jgi:hypothetical protein
MALPWQITSITGKQSGFDVLNELVLLFPTVIGNTIAFAKESIVVFCRMFVLLLVDVIAC